ncbi:serine hydrolase domain-containing protein [Flagellimonas nanhaiensis]|uniref:Class C beta-lactamase-related serine hydrolase n=1 Tax=Flagellimonas nanhaiensis TaxID=2292706 RepID=A0A371JRS6_9FLAO|nr:serine hydrolase [Allomuricauda nanhaiensis]RDY60208.1 class C beta-lactamase-related serine hydrolase [Allomuricauda nanhaiensis]
MSKKDRIHEITSMKNLKKTEIAINLHRCGISICIFVLGLALFSCSEDAQKDESNNEILGYSLEKLQAAEEWANNNTKTAAVVILVDGQPLYQWGNVDTKYISHSTRKSFMSALFGKYVDDGTIDLNTTMAELGIDDIPELTEQEKTATVEHCMQSASGVYHTAEAESDFMHDLKPSQDEYLPGTFWIYNNWDFNVLRTIFEQETQTNFYEALKSDIMDPIGANFQLADSISWVPTRSVHPAYMFKISPTDMSKFGQLMLDKGNWDGNQIIPRDWVEESTKYLWDAEIYDGDGYGYMWWVATNANARPYLPNCNLPVGTYSARGAGGQWMEIIPERNMVFVHMVDTYVRDNVEFGDIGTLLQMVLDSKN